MCCYVRAKYIGVLRFRRIEMQQIWVIVLIITFASVTLLLWQHCLLWAGQNLVLCKSLKIEHMTVCVWTAAVPFIYVSMALLSS